MMRVFIDLRWMVPGYTGGIERMAHSFLNILGKIDLEGEYRILLPVKALRMLSLFDGDRFRTLPSDGLVYKLDRLCRYILTWVTKRREFLDTSSLVSWSKSNSDVGLSLSGYIYPDAFDLKHVVVVSDIQHEFYPEFFSKFELERRRKSYTRSLQAARRICAVSNFTRDSLIKKYAIPPKKINVTYEAADPIFSNPVNPAYLKRIMEKYNLPKGEYLYYPANTWYHKNHLLLLNALKNLGDQTGLKPLFVCSGTAKEAHLEILDRIKKLGLGNQVKFIGFCTLREVHTLYKGAAALVYPSLFEGFGMPVLEAMTVGIPVTCSNVTSLPEIAGDAALYFDPQSEENISFSIEKILVDSDLRNELINSGFHQAEKYSWENFVKKIRLKLTEVYENEL